MVDGFGDGFGFGSGVAGASSGQCANILVVWERGGSWCCVLSLSLAFDLRFWCWLRVFYGIYSTYSGPSVGMCYNSPFQGHVKVNVHV